MSWPTRLQTGDLKGKRMTKSEAFDRLWNEFDYCNLGYDRAALYSRMSKKEVLQRLSWEINGY